MIRNLRQTENAVKNYRERERERIRTYPGILGDGAGNVTTTKTGWYFVRLRADNNKVVKAQNVGNLPPVEATPVDLSKVLETGGSHYAILRISGQASFAQGITDSGYVSAHAFQHEWGDFGYGGFDPLSIYGHAVVPLRAQAQAIPDYTLYVNPGFYINGVNEIYWAGGNSPVFTLPVGTFIAAGRRCDLLYFATDDTLKVAQGTPTGDGSTPARPGTPSDATWLLSYVYLDSTMASIQEQDLEDARPFGSVLLPSTITPSAHDILSAQHGDTLAAAVQQGDLIRGNGTPKWSRLSAKSAGFFVQGDGTDVVSAPFDWDSASAGAGADMVHDHSSDAEGGVLAGYATIDGHLHGLGRWIADGAATTFDLPDVAEYLEIAGDNFLIVDPTIYSLSADGTQLVFDSAPVIDHIITANYVIATV